MIGFGFVTTNPNLVVGPVFSVRVRIRFIFRFSKVSVRDMFRF